MDFAHGRPMTSQTPAAILTPSMPHLEVQLIQARGFAQASPGRYYVKVGWPFTDQKSTARSESVNLMNGQPVWRQTFHLRVANFHRGLLVRVYVKRTVRSNICVGTLKFCSHLLSTPRLWPCGASVGVGAQPIHVNLVSVAGPARGRRRSPRPSSRRLRSVHCAAPHSSPDCVSLSQSAHA